MFRLKKIEIKGEKKWVIIINNSEEMKVTNESELNTMTIKNKQFDYYLIPIITFSGFQTTIQVLTPESRLKLDKHLQSLADKALNTSDKKVRQYLWHEYYTLQKTFDDVAFAYCLTTHKAQGSTFENIILDIADLNSCSDKQKIIYTALTRAKKSVFILQ